MMERYPYPLECLYMNVKTFFDGYLPSHCAQLVSWKKHTVAKRGVEISSYLGSCVDSYIRTSTGELIPDREVCHRRKEGNLIDFRIIDFMTHPFVE